MRSQSSAYNAWAMMKQLKKEKTHRKNRGLKGPIKDIPCVYCEGRWYALPE